MVPRRVEQFLYHPTENQKLIWKGKAVGVVRANVRSCSMCGSNMLLQTYKSGLVYADLLARERAAEGIFELKTEKVPDAIKKFLEKAKKLSEDSVFKNRISETRMFIGELIGEYTILRKEEIIHLTVRRKAMLKHKIVFKLFT